MAKITLPPNDNSITTDITVVTFHKKILYRCVDFSVFDDLNEAIKHQKTLKADFEKYILLSKLIEKNKGNFMDFLGLLCSFGIVYITDDIYKFQDNLGECNDT